jgi:anti-anti-sigma regulatory factor
MKADDSGSMAAWRSGAVAHPAAEKGSDSVLVLSFEAATPGAIVLRCRGRIILRREACALSGLIEEVLPTARRMVVDLAGETTLDSGALGELVLCQMWAESSGYELRFSSSSGSVRRLFESTNLASVLDVHSSVEGALAAMQPQGINPD